METVGQVIRMGNMREGYVAIVKAVAEHGEKVAPRGQVTREFRNATLIVENPLDTLPTGVGRKLVPGIAAVESAQLLAGESRPELVMRIGPQFGKFVEPDGLFHGAYGVRTRGQFKEVVERLKADPSSRQAIATIWKQEFDLPINPPPTAPKKDYPCTLFYDFLIRDDKLHMTVVMRSNDVVLGLGYDAYQHSRVQVAVASVLGVELGEYVHHAVSLHLYERDLPLVDQLTMPQGKAPTFFPVITGKTWETVENKARFVLDQAEKPERVKFVYINEEAEKSQEWYIESMRKAIVKNESKD